MVRRKVRFYWASLLLGRKSLRTTAMTEPPAKKQRLSQAAKHFVCPITGELPGDPVFAEDDHIYDRWAIENHIAKNPRSLRSPMTNKPMGKKLRPAPHIRSAIEDLVASGELDADLVSGYQSSKAESAGLEKMALVQKALRCDASSCGIVARNLLSGKSGFPKNIVMAQDFLKLGSCDPNVDGLRCARALALINMKNETSPVSKIFGIEMLAFSAASGSLSSMIALASIYLQNDMYAPDRSLYWSLVACGFHKLPVGTITDTVIEKGEEEFRAKFCSAWEAAKKSRLLFVTKLDMNHCKSYCMPKAEKELAAAWASENADPSRGPVDDAKVAAVFAAMRDNLLNSKIQAERRSGEATETTQILMHACRVHLMVKTWINTPIGKQVAALDHGKSPGKMVPWWPDDGTDPFKMSAAELASRCDDLRFLVPYYRHTKSMFVTKTLIADWIAYRSCPRNMFV
jgi:hypothetical protein